MGNRTCFPRGRKLLSLGGYIGAWLVVSSTGAPGSSISLNIAEVNGVKGRCDRVVRTTPGCVASENPAVITYDSVAYPKVAEVAEHVYDAQASLPYQLGMVWRWLPADARRRCNRNGEPCRFLSSWSSLQERAATNIRSRSQMRGPLLDMRTPCGMWHQKQTVSKGGLT